MVGYDVSGDLAAHIVVRHPTGFEVDAAIDVAAGGTTALLGPNGAGKSTIVTALGGLQPLTSGFVKLGDRVLEDVSSGVFVRPEDRRIGIVFQHALLFRHLNVLQNIEFGPKSLKRDRNQTREVVEEWIERLELESLTDRKPSQLSGGEIQRVAIARTMATEPELLILDEPLAAIDASARPHVRRLISDFLATFDGPAIVITHDPTEAFLLSESVTILENGVVTDAGPVDAVRLTPKSAYAADLAGVNFVTGQAANGIVTAGAHDIHIADSELVGGVVVTIHPRSISLHTTRPEGSARNVWATTVERIEATRDKVRVLTGDPLQLTAEVTTAGAEAVGLAVGEPIWISIKATEIGATLVSDEASGLLPATNE